MRRPEQRRLPFEADRREFGPSRASWVEDGRVIVVRTYANCVDQAWPWWQPRALTAADATPSLVE